MPTTRMDMKKYGRRKIEGIQAHLNALRMAQKILKSRKTEGVKAIRRISRSLQYAIPSIKDSPILKTLSGIQKANDANVERCLDNLLPHLEELTEQVRPIARAILLVEDDPLVIHVLKKQLSSSLRKFYVAQTLKE